MEPRPPSLETGSPHDEVARHARFVRALAGDLARDADEADDVAAATLAEAVRSGPAGGPGLRAWLRRVAWRTFRRQRRDDERRARRESGAAQREALPATVDLAAEMEMQQAIGAAFETLEEPYRSTLFRRYFHDESPAQIARATRTPVATVKSRLQRGLQQLRARLDETTRGGRGGWRERALALASGGVPVVAAKSVAVPLAVAALVLAGATLWIGRGARDESASTVARRPALEAAATPTVSNASPGAAAPVERSVDLAPSAAPSGALPFASGIVVDEAGAPVVGARIVAGTIQDPFLDNPFLEPIDDAKLDEQTVARTDAVGRFAVAEPTRGLALLHVVDDRFVPASLDDLSIDRAGNQERRVVLRAGMPFEGDVVDTDGRPIETARVLATLAETTVIDRTARPLPDAPTYRSSSSIPTWWHAVDAHGRFRFRAVADASTAVLALAPGYATDGNGRFTGGGRAHVVLRRNSIVVEVHAAEDGSRVADARCFLRDADSLAVLAVGTTFWLGEEWDERQKQEWVARADRHTLRLTVVAPGRRSASVEFPFHRNDEPPHLTVVLEAGEDAPSIRGRVIGADDATVTIASAPTPTPGIAHARLATVFELHADPDGMFVARGLPDGDYRVTASASRCTPAMVDTHAPGGDVSIELVATAALAARVVDANGAACPGFIVHVQTADHDRAWEQQTDADGRTRFAELPATTCFAFARERLRIDDSARPPSTLQERSFVPTESFALASGEVAERTLVAPRRVDARVRVADEDGAPVARTELQIGVTGGSPASRMPMLLREPYHWMSTTDATGALESPLWPGKYELAFVRDGFVNYIGFDVADGERADVVCTVPTLARRAPLHGRIVDAESCDPIADAHVTVVVLRGGVQVAASNWGDYYSPPPKEVRSDADGRFVVESVPVGAAAVWCSFDAGRCGVHQPVTVAGDGTSITLRAVRAVTSATTDAKRVHVRVRTVDRISNRSLEGVSVQIDGDAGDAAHSAAIARSDARGEIEVDVPYFERYTLRTSGPFSHLPPPVVTHAHASVDAVPVDGAIDLRIPLERLPIGERF